MKAVQKAFHLGGTCKFLVVLLLGNNQEGTLMRVKKNELVVAEGTNEKGQVRPSVW